MRKSQTHPVTPFILGALERRAPAADIPRGTREPDEDHLYTEPTDDPLIRADAVNAAVEGYFRVPPVWIGEPPDDATVARLNPSIHHAVVFTQDLESGISMRALRDGTFLFDFTRWDPACQVTIPGYRIPAHQIPHYPSKEHIEAEERAEQIAVLRAQVMNVHQACMATSQWLLRRSSSGIGLPITSAETVKGRDFDDALHYMYNAGNSRDIIRSVSNGNLGLAGSPQFARYVLSVEVLEHAAALFDQIMSSDTPTDVPIVEAIYLGACRHREGRLGEAIVLVWGVCEQLLASAWDRMLESKAISSTRKRKLNSRDYTASVITEALELTHTIAHPLYQKLEVARKARNKWAHEMIEPEAVEVLSGLTAAEGLLEQLHGFTLAVPTSAPTPAVPAWYVRRDC